MGPLRYGLAVVALAFLPAVAIQAPSSAIPIITPHHLDPTLAADLEACQGKGVVAPDNQRNASLCFLARRARRYRHRMAPVNSPVTY